MQDLQTDPSVSGERVAPSVVKPRAIAPWVHSELQTANPIVRSMIPAAIGFAPVLLMLLTWTPDAQQRLPVFISKWFALPTFIVEIFVIAIALRRKLLAAARNQAAPPLRRAVLLALLTIAVFTAAFVAPNPFISLVRTGMWIVHALFALSVMHLCGEAFERGSVTTAFMAGFALFALLFVAFVTQVPDPTTFNWVGALPAAIHIRHLGFYAGAVVGMCIGRFALVSGRTGWTATFAVATLGIALAMATGSRGNLVALGIAFAAGMLLLPALRQRQVVLGVLGSAVLGLVLASCLPLPEGLGGLGRAVAATTGGAPASGRTILWLSTIGAIWERPLFGHGEAQLAFVMKGENPEHPHNFLLQVLLAWGVIGALCIAILAIPFALHTVRGVRRLGGEWLPPFLAMLVLLAYSAYDGTLYHPLSLSIFATCAGLVARGTLVGQTTEPTH